MFTSRLRLTALLLTLLLLLSGCATAENASPTPTEIPAATVEPAATETTAVDDAAPAPWSMNDQGMPFLLFDTDDSPMTFSDLTGKVVYLNFFTSWCPPCKQEMPDILKLQQNYGEELQVVLIHVPDRDTEESARQFLKDNGLDSLRMVEDKDFVLTTRYQLEGYPLSVFIDKEGYLAVYQPGGMTYEMMEKAVQMAGIEAPEAP